jgi:hypothetical protein
MSKSKSYEEKFEAAVIESAIKHVDGAVDGPGKVADFGMFGCSVIDIMRGFFIHLIDYNQSPLVPARMAMAQSILSNAQEVMALNPSIAEATGPAVESLLETVRHSMNVAKWLIGAEAQVLLDDGLAMDTWSPEFFGLD